MKKIIYFISIFFFSNEVFSHNRSESFSVWKVDKNILSGVITVPIREATKIPFLDGETGDLSDHFVSYIRPHVVVRSGDKECFLSTPIRPLKSNSAFIRLEMIFQCENSPPDFMIYTGFYAPSHLHYSRLSFEDGNISENLFQSKRTEWSFKKESVFQSSSFFGFVVAGVEHIGTGADHIVFLLAVLLASKHWKEVLFSITGFTLGHSFTLSIATLGKIKPDTSGIEAFIGLTILIVTAKYVLAGKKDRSQIPFWIAFVPLIVGGTVWSLEIRETHILFAYIGMSFFTFCYLSFNRYITDSRAKVLYLGISTFAFGMIHGFGFAGFLLETGLDRNHLLIPLLGFNLGVEIGQLILIGLVFVIIWCLFRKIKPEFKELVLLCLLFLLATLGAYWFFQRSFEIHS
ncbi:HupE/UreJ family protein [Leptospira noguchii]|uniref:HupE/UreJ family protein n=1 Tax=Leptospira noguchii TaxID=28182 RepID=UPI0002BF9230|nr:HupE/UreJ family protein [Leptospira noguchii]EMI65780.1 HupE/UreJ protein [Leptospira noguchii str. Bonito]